MVSQTPANCDNLYCGWSAVTGVSCAEGGCGKPTWRQKSPECFLGLGVNGSEINFHRAAKAFVSLFFSKKWLKSHLPTWKFNQMLQKLLQLFTGGKRLHLKATRVLMPIKYLLFSLTHTRLSNLCLAETNCNYISQSKSPTCSYKMQTN